MTKKKTKIDPSFAELAQLDWVIFTGATRLHALGSLEDPVAADFDWSGWGFTACGRRSWLSIPGLFSRMGLQRCYHCCRILGFPQGEGSPKNDDVCRKIMGLPKSKKLTKFPTTEVLHG